MMPLKGWYFTVRLTAPDGSAPRDDRWRPVDQIEDIGSTNGTSINGERIAAGVPHPLKWTVPFPIVDPRPPVVCSG